MLLRRKKIGKRFSNFFCSHCSKKINYKLLKNKDRKQLEIDFVCNKGAERIYIQSSFALPSIEKEQQEKRSLNNVYDSFRKIVIVKEDILTRKDSNGIITMGLKDFITNKNSLDEI